ncbi:hypothetical protein HK405_013397, partial [Cladochytrium tenue]
MGTAGPSASASSGFGPARSSVAESATSSSSSNNGDNSGDDHDHVAGMIPRALGLVFDRLAELTAADAAAADQQQQQPDQPPPPRRRHSLRASYLELYNEEWVDLLRGYAPLQQQIPPPSPARPGTPGGSVRARASAGPLISAAAAAFNAGDDVVLREDRDGRISVAGAAEVELWAPADALRVLAHGSRCRTTAATAMNDRSSRSHAIFTLTLTTTTTTTTTTPAVPVPAPPTTPVARSRRVSLAAVPQSAVATAPAVLQTRVTSKFHFVDLAGSERLKRTQNTGERKAEGIAINQGLLVLGRVIHALSEMEEAASGGPASSLRVAPYRESKLTRFLQDSLGGTSRTVMLACVSPSEADLPETTNTLRYASRAQRIRNRTQLHVETTTAAAATAAGAGAAAELLARQVERLQQELGGATLRAEQAESELARLRARAAAPDTSDSPPPSAGTTASTAPSSPAAPSPEPRSSADDATHSQTTPGREDGPGGDDDSADEEYEGSEEDRHERLRAEWDAKGGELLRRYELLLERVGRLRR